MKGKPTGIKVAAGQASFPTMCSQKGSDMAPTPFVCPPPPPPTPIGSEGGVNRPGSETHQNDTGNSGAVSEERLKVLFALDDSVKTSLAEVRASNPRAKPALDQVNRVIDKGDTQVIKIPELK